MGHSGPVKALLDVAVWQRGVKSGGAGGWGRRDTTRFRSGGAARVGGGESGLSPGKGRRGRGREVAVSVPGPPPSRHLLLERLGSLKLRSFLHFSGLPHSLTDCRAGAAFLEQFWRFWVSETSSVLSPKSLCIWAFIFPSLLLGPSSFSFCTSVCAHALLGPCYQSPIL